MLSSILEFLPLLIIIIILVGILIFVGLFLWLHQWWLPKIKINKILSKSSNDSDPGKKVLVIYPHPDDETMSSGLLINKFVQSLGIEVKVISVTQGEAGDELVKADKDSLAKIRTREFSKVMRTLGVTDFEMWDFPDGGIKSKLTEVSDKLEKLISDYNPDLIVTYEKWGIYGHPNHVYLAKAVTEVAEEKDVKVLYSTYSPKVIEMVGQNLPTHMAEDEDSLSLTDPEYILIDFQGMFLKFKLAGMYASQWLFRRRPKIIYSLIMSVEYYSTKYPDSQEN
jgi:LmbE family N-acetylglucosaminyl deacetylase